MANFTIPVLLAIATPLAAVAPSASNASLAAPTGPYCGVYSLHRAVSGLGLKVPIGDLVRPDYISTKNGSTADDLARAAQDLGCHAEGFRKLSWQALRVLDPPLILHVRGDVSSKAYDHWILYAGTRDDRVIYYDGIGGEQSCSSADLCTRWDGSGMIVSRWPISTARLYGIALTAAGANVLLIGGAWFLLMTAVSKGNAWLLDRLSLMRRCGDALGALAVAGIGVATYTWVAAAVLPTVFGSEEAIRAIQDNNYGTFVPKVTAGKMEDLVRKKACVVIDARLERDYVAGHILTAINVPVNVSHLDSGASLAHVGREQFLVVYCQSNGCPYSDRVARRLAELGFQKVAIYRDGWLGWKSAHKNDDPNTTAQLTFLLPEV